MSGSPCFVRVFKVAFQLALPAVIAGFAAKKIAQKAKLQNGFFALIRVFTAFNVFEFFFKQAVNFIVQKFFAIVV